MDDKSGYDHLLLADASRTYFGIQWGGWYFVYNTLPFCWKVSPFVYHSTGLVATNFLRSLGVPCLLYIDDRHNGQLQVDLTRGPYSQLQTADERNHAVANSAVFLFSYYLIRLGIFWVFSSLFSVWLKLYHNCGSSQTLSNRLSTSSRPRKRNSFI